MQRITARLLMVLALVGTFAPVALAIAGPAPHACCLRAGHSCPLCRKTHHGITVDAVHKGDCGRCCPPNVPAQWAQLLRPTQIDTAAVSATLITRVATLQRAPELYSVLPARAPPAC
ncbi:MAG TPA: hypothetical protein VMH85_17160 [Terriglobales bacterium]|nr:hypothetical protein [Terriglobales bacterium]